jgi:hypothetical protein
LLICWRLPKGGEVSRGALLDSDFADFDGRALDEQQLAHHDAYRFVYQNVFLT